MKYLKYILILLLIAGIFSPSIKAKADDKGPKGTCIWSEVVKDSTGKTIRIEERSQKDMYEIDCDSFIAQNTSLRQKIDWNADTTSDTGSTPTTNNKYHLLAPLPCDSTANPPIPGCKDGKLETFDPTGGGNNFGRYLNVMIKIFIGICAVLAVVMIVIGGVEYMTSELAHTKESGKDRITHAILGLVIALGAYALLFTINPDLLNSDLDPPVSGITVDTTQPLGICTVTTKPGTPVKAPYETTELKCTTDNPGSEVIWKANPPKPTP